MDVFTGMVFSTVVLMIILVILLIRSLFVPSTSVRRRNVSDDIKKIRSQIEK